MNCWVCGGHGHVIHAQDETLRLHIQNEALKEKRVPEEILICHYCVGSGYIEMEE